MTSVDYIEFACTIISTLSIVISSIILCHHFLLRISFYIIFENQYIKVYASALQNKIMLKNIKIRINKKVINNDDIFFSGGSDKMELIVGEYKLIKMTHLNFCTGKFAKINVETEFGKSFFRIVRIRRK